MSRNPYRKSSIRYVIAEQYLIGTSQGRAWHIFKDKVGTGNLVFSENVEGRRVPLAHQKQRRALWQTIERVYREMAAKGIPQGEGSPAPEAPSPKAPDAPKAPADPRERLLAEVERLRAFCNGRKVGGSSLDDLETMRPIVYGKAMLAGGIPVEACISAMTLHWPEEIRREAKVTAFDPMTFGEPIPGLHRAVPYFVAMAEQRVPMMAVGGKGVGKSVIAKHLAKHLELPYGECPMTAGATPGWLGGSWTIQKFIDRKFLRIYTGGGIFNFEEMDASDPNLLLFVNNALANDVFENPIDGQEYHRSKDFIAFATANTFGLGANREYTGRERLDAATVDRFRMGRVKVPLDKNLEREILFA